MPDVSQNFTVFPLTLLFLAFYLIHTRHNEHCAADFALGLSTPSHRVSKGRTAGEWTDPDFRINTLQFKRLAECS